MKCPYCEATESRNGYKPFTVQSLEQHIKDAHTDKRTCPKCGRSRSNKGRPFTEETLAQHVQDCRGKKHHDSEWDHPALEMADLIAGDEPDGVYWGIAHEFGYFG